MRSKTSAVTTGQTQKGNCVYFNELWEGTLDENEIKARDFLTNNIVGIVGKDMKYSKEFLVDIICLAVYQDDYDEDKLKYEHATMIFEQLELQGNIENVGNGLYKLIGHTASDIVCNMANDKPVLRKRKRIKNISQI